MSDDKCACAECGHARHANECWAACAVCSGHAPAPAPAPKCAATSRSGRPCSGLLGHAGDHWTALRDVLTPAPDKSAGCPTCEHDLGEHRVDDLGSFCMIYDCPCAASVSRVEILGAVIGAAAREQVAVVNAAAPASEKPIVNCGCGNPAIHGSENCWPHSYPAPDKSAGLCPHCGEPMVPGYWASTRRCDNKRCDVGTLPVEFVAEILALRAEVERLGAIIDELSLPAFAQRDAAKARVATLEAALREIVEYLSRWDTQVIEAKSIARAALEGKS